MSRYTNMHACVFLAKQELNIQAIRSRTDTGTGA